MKPPSIVPTLLATRPGNWAESLYLLLFTLVGGVLSVVFSWVWVRYQGHDPSLLEFARRGDFALYAASIASPLLFLIGHDRKTGFFPARHFLLLIAVVVFLLVIVSYCLLSAAEILKSANADAVDQMAFGSMVLFAVTLVLALVVQAIDASRSGVDVAALAHKQESSLASEFDRLGR